MRNLLAAEWAKIWSGRAAWSMALIGLVLGVLAAGGYATGADAGIANGTTTIQDVTDQLVRCWLAMLVLSALLGTVYVSREYQAGTIGRSVLLSGGRTRLFGAKLAVGTAMGVAFGLLAAGCAALSPWIFLRGTRHDPVWTRETTLTLVGIFVVTVLAAPWGALIGWILRKQAAAVAVVLGLSLFVDEALLAAAPAVGKFTMTIAMSSVYRDGKPELLGAPWAFLVIAGWLTAAGCAAHWLLHRRDVL
ncbi:ABC transporter permease [Streptomyces sp. NPDC029674]|uniref:ABC transporter permease n=1 Tax=Streptomyces sp. NPDC029674 TaxID=3365297 RepID=UPI00384D2CB9